MKTIVKRILFWILSFTWGFIMSFIGLIGFGVAKVCGCKSTVVGNIVVTEASIGGGICLGPFVFLDCARVHHEYGHAIQNIIFGPLFPFLIGIPSITRAGWRSYRISKGKYPKTDYDDIWFEGQATKLGKKYL